MEIEKKMSFSYDLESGMTEDERKVDKIMKRLKLKVKDEYFNSVLHHYFDNKVSYPPKIMNHGGYVLGKIDEIRYLQGL